MVEDVGSLRITGSIDVTSVKTGLQRMRSEMEKAKASTQSLFGDVVRIGRQGAQSIGGLALATTGLAGGLIALSSVGPGTAVALERMKLESQRLGFFLDQFVGPALNRVVDQFGGLIDVIEGNPALKNLVGTFSDLAIQLAPAGALIAGVGIFAAALRRIPKSIRVGLSVLIGFELAQAALTPEFFQKALNNEFLGLLPEALQVGAGTGLIGAGVGSVVPGVGTLVGGGIGFGAGFFGTLLSPLMADLFMAIDKLNSNLEGKVS